MHWALSVKTGPSEEPVTVQDALDHLREDSDIAQFALIDSLIRAAREHVESYTRRALVTQTLKYRIPDFRGAIKLPRPPVASVTSIKYIDLDGAEQTLSASVYDVDTDSEPGVVTLGWHQVWPSVRDVQLPVSVTYQAGYGNASDVPMPIRQAILLLITHWYESRSAVSMDASPTETPMAVDSLLYPYRVLSL